MNRMGLFAGIAGIVIVAVVALVLVLNNSGGEDDATVEATIAPETGEVEAADTNTEEAAGDMADQASTGDMAGETSAAYSGPDWANLPLTNVSTGETFTLADFAGQTVLVHGMATWCTTCHSAHESLRDNVVPEAGEDIVFVSLSVETGLPDDRLANYAAGDDFNWTFAVVTPELLAELTRQFGAGITTPPVRPHFIIGPNGEVSDMMRGQANPDALLETLRTFGRA